MTPRESLEQMVAHVAQHGGRALPARLAPTDIGATLDVALVRLVDARQSGDWMLAYNHERVIEALLGLQPLLERPRLEALIETAHEDDDAEVEVRIEWRTLVVDALECWRAAHPDEEIRTLTQSLLGYLVADTGAMLRRPRDERRLRERVELLAGHTLTFWPEPGTPFAEAMVADMREMPASDRAAWGAFLAQAAGTDAARPSARWQRETAARVAAIGDFVAQVTAWFARVEKPKELRKTQWALVPPISDGNTRILTALVWATAGLGGPDLARVVGDLGAVCFSKIPEFGAVSKKVGNACLWALGAMPGLDGVSQLSRLKLRVKYSQAQRLIGRSLDVAATRAGLAVADLEELAVPSFGLDHHGRATTTLGEWTATVEVGRGVSLHWAHATKKSPKSPPKDAKADPGWKEFKKRLAEIEQRLVIERSRLERLYLQRREIGYGDFVERYLDHPLVSTLARRLLWNVVDDGRTQVAVWRGGSLGGLDGVALSPGSSARVSLWHPLGQPEADVLVWQDFLEQHGIVQPFKQVHREVYTLDGETGLHSNRFAGHVLRQHQFAALLQARGWRFRLMGAFDSHNTPTVELPAWGLSAGFAVDYPSDGATTAAGIYLHVRTDAVQFLRGGEPVPIDEVPSLLYSETMRDVDLFVGVSTIGTDPTWRDRGGPFEAYWMQVAYGALSRLAESRRALLQQLVPRMSDRISVETRYLVVRGRARTYRIHIGSGQVLMDPGDLAVVLPELSSASVTLPFEGDEGLRTLLARALHLLAEDR